MMFRLSPILNHLVHAAIIAALLAISASLRAEKPAIDFVHDIVPILRVHCGKCHAGDARQGGFSINTRAKMLAGGDSGMPGFAPGNAANSELIKRVMSEDLDYRMPSEGPPLEDKQIALLRRWIDAESPWTEGFAFKGAGYEAPLNLRRVTLPPAQAGRTHPIDRLIDAYWQKHDVRRPARADDRTFIRRVSLDLVGLLPEPERVERFVADADPEKRTRLVRELLAENVAYAEHWLSFWNDLLRNDYTGTGFITGGRRQITTWLHRGLVANKPYDQFVRELVAPTDESRGFIDGIVWRGEVNASQTVPIQFAQNYGQTFLGINLKCASCHDSFIDRWTLKQTYDLAAIYAGQPLELHRCDKATGTMATPAWLFGELGQIDVALSPAKRLEKLAELTTRPENGWLTRTLVNRLWQRMLGRGIVHPVDALRAQPWDEDLLDYLAGELVAHQWNVKHLLERIATSEAYGAVTPTVDDPPGADYVFRGPLPRRMTAEQFCDAIWTLTGTAPPRPDADVIRFEIRESDAQATPPRARWIWSNGEAKSPPGEKLAFRATFKLTAQAAHAVAVLACDNEATLFVNGTKSAACRDWTQPAMEIVTAKLKPGENELLVTAVNGAAGGPAALRVEFRARLVNGSDATIASDGSWQWSASVPNDNGKYGKGKEPTDWAAAEEIESPEIWASAGPAFTQQLRVASPPGPLPMVRASLVKGTALMAALGRPNRDQVVTSRPTDLTTLEAIQLANEPGLADEFTEGGQRILKLSGPTPEPVIESIFAAALSRKPTSGEVATLRELLGAEPTARSVADCLWAVLMLPEFQLVR